MNKKQFSTINYQLAYWKCLSYPKHFLLLLLKMLPRLSNPPLINLMFVQETFPFESARRIEMTMCQALLISFFYLNISEVYQCCAYYKLFLYNWFFLWVTDKNPVKYWFIFRHAKVFIHKRNGLVKSLIK